MAVHVFDTMGTTVSLRFAGALPGPDVLCEVEQVFSSFDRRFSLYRRDSEISRVACGELPLQRSSPELRRAYADALEWGRRTAGAFTPHRPDGIIDLSGTVKADAIEAAGCILDAAGATAWMLNAGGDILVRGSLGDAPWRVGIVDPDDRSGLLCAVDLTGSRRALATSGTAERGEHVWRVRASGGAVFRQVSVRADDILTADVLSTAIMSAGPERCQEIIEGFDVDAVMIDDRGLLTATPGLTTQGLARV